jgi:hypothetical protein
MIGRGREVMIGRERLISLVIVPLVTQRIFIGNGMKMVIRVWGMMAEGGDTFVRSIGMCSR